MRTYHLALVSELAAVDASALMQVSAALQKQLTQDFGPIWNVNATIDPFANAADVPPGYWLVTVTAAGLPAHLLGVHHEENGQPIAYVEWSDSWSITASHECMELLVDPSGNEIRSGRSPDDENEHVDYLLEICDPCQAITYQVNGILVSDFYTPSYFDPTPRSGGRYSFTGAITSPLQVLDGGYLSWRERLSGDWWQVDGAGKRTKLGALALGARGFRQQIDERSDHLRSTKLSRDVVLAMTRHRRERARAVATRRAEALRAHLARANRPDSNDKTQGGHR